jgi:hypothetical protein
MLRLWIFLLTLAAGIAAALMIIAPRGISEDLDHETDLRLERTHHAASLLLRVNARKWIDTSAQVASDVNLIESLDQATKGPVDLAMVHASVQQRLKYFNDRMKVDLVAATDAHGRVIARVGVDSAIYKDSIEGYPLIADALRGLRGDDTWSIGGKLYRVAASPVIQHDHYVGAVVIGQEATAELAESMKAVLGTEVVLLLRGRVIASTAALPILDKLPVAATAHAQELAHGGRSSALTIDHWAVILGSFVGEASEHQAIYALCTPRHTGTSLEAIVAGLLRDPRSIPRKQLIPVAAGTLAALVLGLLIVWLGVSRPLDTLVRHVQALSRGELQRLPDGSGRYGVLTRAVNTTLERIAGRVRAETRSAQSLLAQSSGDTETQKTSPRGRTSQPPVDPPKTIETPAVQDIPEVPPPTPTPPPPTSASRPTRPLGSSGPPPPPEPRPTTSLLASGEFDDRKTVARDEWPPAPPELPPATSRPVLFTQTMTPLPPPMLATDTEPVSITAPPTAPNPLPPPEPLSSLRPTARAIPTAKSLTAPRSGFEEPTSVESPSEALLVASAHGTSEEIENDFRRVFDDFIATRTQCGEALEGVTFDKFVIKLRQNRSQLIERYGCASVRFQVYIKDGKAALKATPVT